MTNLDKWIQYTSGLSSPQNYIEWGWRYLVNASLQRRVWCGPEHQACFPNMYVIFVGPPGVGKGLVIRDVSNFLKHWKLKDAIKLTGEVGDKFKQNVEAIATKDLQDARECEIQGTNKQTGISEPLLIPVAADATTYEALVKAVANSYRRINYIKPDNTLGIYGHSSLCFSLQELASLLRKRTDDTVNYMLGLYDCPADYEYDTKTQGKDRIRRGCLNILAGTTPSFMQSIFNDELIDEGFSSRSFFIYAAKNRKTQFFIPALTKDQEQCRTELLDHIRKLTCLYGHVSVSQDTWEFLVNWWEKYSEDMERKTKLSPKLVPYDARKNIHVMKLAMSLHFSESLDMTISTETFQRAIDLLAREEKNMHLAITIEGKNNIAGVAKKILDLLHNGKKNFVDLHFETFDIAKKSELEEALTFLQETSQITTDTEKDETTLKDIIFYRKVKNE